MTTRISKLTRQNMARPLVQISLDLTNVREALDTAAIAVEAGVDWIEVGTPLVLAEGLHGVRALKKNFPDHPIVVDLKTMDGGYLEAEMMADAGADAVVVMGRAHDATVDCVVAAGAKYDMLVMGDNLGAPDMVAEAARLEQRGVGMIIHHIGFDHRNAHPELGLSPLTELEAVVAATTVPVQAVGGLSLDDAVACVERGAPVVVFGAPLAIAGQSFAPSSNPQELLRILTEATERVHGTPLAGGSA